MMVCWAVVYSNYHPLEIDSLWYTRELAQEHADMRNGKSTCAMWTVVEMEIRTKPRES